MIIKNFSDFKGGAMGQMMKLLKEKDPTLHKHLVSQSATSVAYGTNITNFTNFTDFTSITLVAAATYGTKITNFTNLTSITLVAAVAYGTNFTNLLPLATKFSVDVDIIIFLPAAKGWYGPNLLWISLDHFTPLSGISPPWYKKEIPSIVNVSEIFPFSEVIRIWDSLFADEKRFDFLIFLCAAMIM